MYEHFRQAIECLGQGLLAHPANRALRRKLTSGALGARGYYEQLVVLTYRLVLATAANAPQRVPSPAGVKPFLDDSLADLAGCELEAEVTKDALQLLAMGLKGQATIAGLGAVHEALLELEPTVEAEGRKFKLSAGPESHRKRTGSYYTPAAFIDSLLDSTLEPVMDRVTRAAVQDGRRRGASPRQARRLPERALLDLTICDPACGAGYFLVAAAQRLARRLATVRATDREPSPAQMRAALRDVIGRCIYGVDLSPAAVELCRVTLQLELLKAGSRPVGDLHERIVCGNALLGIVPGSAPNSLPEPLEGGLDLFEWSRAFPGIFARSDDGQDARPPGFDVVIGNPPYRAVMTQPERQAANLLYPLAAPTSNSAADFVELCSRIVRPGEHVGLVVPKSLTYSYSWRKLRAEVAPVVASAIDVGRGWNDVLLEQVLLTFTPGRRNTRSVRVGILKNGSTRCGQVSTKLIERLGILPTGLTAGDLKLLECVLRHSQGTLSNVCTTRRGTGLQSMLRPTGDIPVVAGRDIEDLSPLRPSGFVHGDEVEPERLRWTEPPQAIFQNIIAHVTRPADHIRLIGTLAQDRLACLDTVNLLTIHDPVLSPAGLCAFLMSDLLGWYVYACIYNKAIRTMHFDGYFLAKIPLPHTGSLSSMEHAAKALANDPNRPENWQAVNEVVFGLFKVPNRLRDTVPAIRSEG